MVRIIFPIRFSRVLFSLCSRLLAAAVVYLGPNTRLVADTATGGSFPIMAYSTTDNTSLSYVLRFNPPQITLQNSSVLMVAAGTPVNEYFVDVR